MRVLYTGGTGEISFDCIHELVRLGRVYVPLDQLFDRIVVEQEALGL